MATTELCFYHGASGRYIGKLIECDVHGSGRQNHAWMGTIRGIEIYLPNLKAVHAYARDNDFEFVKTIVSE